MIITANAVDLTDVDLLSDDVGGIWDSFKLNITDTNINRLVSGYNLIKISLPDTNLSTDITDLLLDENFDTPFKTQALLELMLTNIIDILTRVGFTLNGDYLDLEVLDTLIKVLDLFAIIDGYEDLMDISNILESRDIDPVQRFIRVYDIVYLIDEYGDEAEVLATIIDDISEVVLEGLRLCLVLPELDIVVPDNIKLRIDVNRELLTLDTLAGAHIRNDGSLGSTFENLLSFYSNELTLIKDVDAFGYCKELILLLLISEVNNGSILDVFRKHTDGVIADMQVEFKLTKLIDGIKYE